MIEQGDCLDLMKKVPDESVDAIVTDPPYGLSFMNKSWDTFSKGMKDFFVPIWKECLRVLKPGAFAFVMSSPRQDTMADQILALKEAGFEIGFTSLYWTYATGFPKSMNISKTVDRKLGYDREVISGTKKDTEYSGKFDQKPSSEREKLGYPVSDEAKSLDGSYAGFQPKPAQEPILVAMKPLSEKTYVEQALKNGKGISWLDDGKIPYKSKSDMSREIWGNDSDIQVYGWAGGKDHKGENNGRLASEEGRFPANLLVQDDVLNDRTIHTSGLIEYHHNLDSPTTQDIYGKYERLQASKQITYGDSGSFSRYFDLDAWYEKNIESLPDYVQRVFPFLIVPKPSQDERNKGLDDLPLGKNLNATYGMQTEQGLLNNNRHPENGSYEVRNIHPTVKPLKLMTYLVTIASRKGDTILDPFMGSGTTGVACKLLDRKFIGFEKEGKYFEIAEERINMVGNISDYEVDE